MLWPCPRLALFFLCVASCELIAASFGVGTTSETSFVRRSSMAHRSGPHRGSSNYNNRNRLSMVGGGLNENDTTQGNIYVGARKRTPVVQAVAEVETIPEVTVPTPRNKVNIPELEKRDGSSKQPDEGPWGVPPLPSPFNLPEDPPSSTPAIRDGERRKATFLFRKVDNAQPNREHSWKCFSTYVW